MKNHLKYLLITATVITVAGTSANTHANNWFSKGLDLLKGTTSDETADSTEESSSLTSSLLSNDNIIDGFKQALEIGSTEVTQQLGAMNGFNEDELIHIPLPENLQKARSVLEKVGMSSLADDLELKLNRAAEAAAPEARDVFINAIKAMTFEDIQTIYKGEDDAATQYFRANMTEQLSAKMRPIIDSSLSEVGAIAAYDKFVGSYSSIPFVPDLKANLNTYVVEKGLDGIFHYLAEEEAAIRQDPLKRTTDLLQQVFGSLQ